MLKILSIALLISSCATKPKEDCKWSRSEQFAGTKYVEYQCIDYRKFCKYDTMNSDRKISCFTTRQ